jgi:hypothetical protein
MLEVEAEPKIKKLRSKPPEKPAFPLSKSSLKQNQVVQTQQQKAAAAQSALAPSSDQVDRICHERPKTAP